MPQINSGASYGTREQASRSTANRIRGSNRYEQAWEEMFDSLLEYKSKYGDCLVPRSYKEDPKLGRWVNKQRTRRGTLSSERKERLEKEGFIWCLQKHEEWNTMRERLLQFKDQNGNCRVPQGYKQDPKLGKWVDNQRHHQKTGQLSEERKKLLDEVGFSWKVIETWDEMYQQLKEYKRKFGNCLVPQKYPKLGNWVRLQRVRRNSRSIEQKRKLKSIGFVWNAKTENWRDVY